MSNTNPNLKLGGTNKKPAALASGVTPPVKPKREDPSLLPAAAYNIMPVAAGVAVPVSPQDVNPELKLYSQGNQTKTLPVNVQAASRMLIEENNKFVPTVDTSIPPAVMNMVDISQLPPAEQQRIRGIMAEALQTTVPKPVVRAAPAAQPISEEELVTMGSQRIDTRKPANEYSFSTAVQEEVADPYLVVPDPPVTLEPPTPHNHPTAQSGNNTGAEVPLLDCPHCGWDLTRTDIPEPTNKQKQTFLHAILGQIPYTETYPLLGDKLYVRFRTLNTAETDQIFYQAVADREKKIKNNVVQHPLDFQETVQRYRLVLQLISLQADSLQLNVVLPEGLDPESNPKAKNFYEVEDLQGEKTALPAILNYFLQNVFANETIMRITGQKLNEFNRTVAKMEAMADNSNFWKTTS